MHRRAGTVSALLVLALLGSGCSGDDSPPPVANTSSTSEASETPDDGKPTTDPTEEPAALVFGGQSGAAVDNECGDRSPVYLSARQTLEVTQEVRLGEVTVAGGGRRGFAEELTDDPQWEQRVPLQGVLVQPGRYVAFAHLSVGPRSPLQGLDFAFFDSNAPGSAQLAMPVSVEPQCD